MADYWESNGGERARAEILIGLDRLRTFLKGEQNIGEGPPHQNKDARSGR